MTTASPLAFPGGRTLANWWKLLGAWQLSSFWFGYLHLHRLEASSQIRKSYSLDPSSQLVLRAVGLSPYVTIEDLDCLLHLGRQVTLQLLRFLAEEGLVEGPVNGPWTLTPAGGLAAGQGSYVRCMEERRTFVFVSGDPRSSQARFLPLEHASANPWTPPEDWHFELHELRKCVEQSNEWKERHGFPRDVVDVFDLKAAENSVGTSRSWRHIPVDRPERLPIVLGQTALASGSEGLLGFAVHPESWSLQADQPLLKLGSSWQETFPELAAPVKNDLWHQTWRTWCQPRNLPQSEVEACVLTRVGTSLRISAPSRLVDRLRAARSDIIKGEAWVLVGINMLREAVLLELL